jgi:DNA polymerase-3 subunit gamma/tau
MTYTVFARKYRPRTFDEVVGQEHVVRTLKNAIERGRVGHAYLFSGPRGTGKTTLARILAKSLNCAAGPTVAPCGRCELCLSIQAGADADVVEIDAASRRLVEDAEKLREGIQYAPLRARSKIVILDEIHMLSDHAFNALLKTFEEPPPRIQFILATTDPQKVPETIRSRCQHFAFRRLAPAQIADALGRIVAAEGLQIPPAVLRTLALQAQGSLRDAESMLDQLAAFRPEGVTEEDLRGLLGAAPEAWILKLTDRVGEAALGDVLAMVEECYLGGADPATLLDQAIDHYRRLLHLKATGRTDAPEEAAAALKRQVEKLTPQAMLYAIQVLLESRRRLSGDADERLILELAFAKLALSADLPALAELVERAAEAGPRPAPPPLVPRPPTAAPARPWAPPKAAAPLPEAPNPPPVPAEGYSPADLGTAVERWPSIVQSVGADALAGSAPIALDGDELTVLLRPGADAASLAEAAVVRAIGQAAAKAVGRPLRLQFGAADATPSVVPPAVQMVFPDARVIP